MNVLAFGEILWDIISGEYHLGGAPFNFAAHTVKAGNNASILSAVGDDDLGTKAIARARQLGVKTTYISKASLPTGTVDVFLNDGQPDYTIHENVAFDYIPQPDQQLIRAEGYDVFYFGSLIQRNEFNRKTLSSIFRENQFKEVFYDINIRKDFYSKEIVEESLRHCTVFKINDSEARIISNLFFQKKLGMKEFANRIASDYRVSVIIITAAENGCYIMKDNNFNHVPGTPVKVADAVGAGDSFSAAFMHTYLKTGDEVKAATIANRIGAYVASCHGAIPDYNDEILEFLK